MERYFRIRYIIAIAMMLCCVIISLMAIQGESQTQPLDEGEMNTSFSLRMQGFTTTEFDKHGPISRLKADELSIGPRNYFVFNIRPLNETVLKNVKLETYYDSNESPDERESRKLNKNNEFLIGNTTQKNSKIFGINTRCRIFGFNWEIYRDGEPGIVVQAKAAQINFQSHKLKLSEVRMYDRRSHKFIAAHSAVWNEKQKSFIIPGDYMAMTPRGHATGKGIRLDLNLCASPLS